MTKVAHNSRRKTFRPRIECLEDRALMASFTVDDSFVANNPAQHKYTTIQAAVDAAANGDRIKVLPGTYAENVVVSKSLTIQGANAKLTEYLNPAKASIVDPVDNGSVGPSLAFNLLASDSTITGFTIDDHDGNTDTEGSVGIQTSASGSGYRIQGNVIENSSIGIYLNTSTDPSVHQTAVLNNTIRNNNEFLGVAAASGNGIYSDQGARNVRVTSNTFGGHQNEDVIFVGNAGTQTDITVQNNTLKTSSGIFFINVADSKIIGNKITQSLYNAIELAGGNTNVAVTNNTLAGVGTLGYHGIILHNAYSAGPNTNNTLEHNTITNAGLSGIVIRDSNNNTLKNNGVTGSLGDDHSSPAWGSGISLENATNNLLLNNTLKNNTKDGIRLDATSVDNVLSNNYALGNTEHDYHDDSLAPGNTWTNNRGHTQNQAGLISKFI